MRTTRQKLRRAFVLKGGLVLATAIIILTPKFEMDLSGISNPLVTSAQAFE